MLRCGLWAKLHVKGMNKLRAVITRVSSASVTIGGEVTGRIGQGFLVLLGIHADDGEGAAVKLADKICGLRVFSDAEGKMNLGLADCGGRLLVVSNFTLYGNCSRGRRPDFLEAAKPDKAIPLYELFLSRCAENGFPPQHGEFGADMQVESVNDGPVTLIIDN